MNESEILKLDKFATKSLSRYLFLIVKRIFDLLCAIIGCILLIPIIVIIKICYILTGDFHSIFYSHERIGQYGTTFKLYKFRSMVPNADEVLKKMLEDPKYKKEWQKYQKIENDPRITKIGKILRKTSLDEAPQFINILKGDMSLIGPRPLIQGELDEHNGNHELYESIRPGLTSWWACNGRSAKGYDERLALEYYYIKNQSILLDIKCIIKTILIVIKREGAK